MKLTYLQLEPHLSKTLATAYIINGDEIQLKQDARQLLHKAAQQAGFNEQTHFSPQTAADWEQLYPLLNTTSLFAEKRLLVLDCQDHSPPKAASVVLQEYAKNPNPHNLLIIDTNRVDEKAAKNAWYHALEKAGVAITIWPIPREQLPQWIIQRSKRYRLQMNIDAANLLADFIEGNLVAAAQAIEKIYLLKPQRAVDLELVKQVLTDESHFTVFDFVENLIAGNPSRTLHILETLKNEGIEPVLILWGITRELRMLQEMSQQLKQGITYDALFQKHRIFTKRQPAVRRFLAKATTTDAWNCLTHAAMVDKIIKGASPGNAWESLQLLCLRLV